MVRQISRALVLAVLLVGSQAVAADPPSRPYAGEPIINQPIPPDIFGKGTHIKVVAVDWVDSTGKVVRTDIAWSPSGRNAANPVDPTLADGTPIQTPVRAGGGHADLRGAITEKVEIPRGTSSVTRAGGFTVGENGVIEKWLFRSDENQRNMPGGERELSPAQEKIFRDRVEPQVRPLGVPKQGKPAPPSPATPSVTVRQPGGCEPKTKSPAQPEELNSGMGRRGGGGGAALGGAAVGEAFGTGLRNAVKERGGSDTTADLYGYLGAAGAGGTVGGPYGALVAVVVMGGNNLKEAREAYDKQVEIGKDLDERLVRHKLFRNFAAIQDRDIGKDPLLRENDWLDLLKQPGGEKKMRERLADSGPAQEMIDKIANAHLGKRATDAQKKAMRDRLANGAQLVNLERDLVHIQQTYEDILGRKADDEGIARWLKGDIANADSPEQLRAHFTNSEEFDRRLTREFKERLGREPLKDERENVRRWIATGEMTVPELLETLDAKKINGDK